VANAVIREAVQRLQAPPVLPSELRQGEDPLVLEPRTAESFEDDLNDSKLNKSLIRVNKLNRTHFKPVGCFGVFSVCYLRVKFASHCRF